MKLELEFEFEFRIWIEQRMFECGETENRIRFIKIANFNWDNRNKTLSQSSISQHGYVDLIERRAHAIKRPRYYFVCLIFAVLVNCVFFYLRYLWSIWNAHKKNERCRWPFEATHFPLCGAFFFLKWYECRDKLTTEKCRNRIIVSLRFIEQFSSDYRWKLVTIRPNELNQQSVKRLNKIWNFACDGRWLCSWIWIIRFCACLKMTSLGMNILHPALQAKPNFLLQSRPNFLLQKKLNFFIPKKVVFFF